MCSGARWSTWGFERLAVRDSKHRASLTAGVKHKFQ